MKKIFFYAFAGLALTLAACGGAGTNEPAEPAIDSTAIRDSIANAEAMQAKKDSIEAAEKAAMELAAKMPTCKQVVKIIDAAWGKKLSSSNSLLSELGMSCLKFRKTPDEVCDEIESFYGKNAEIKEHKTSYGYYEYEIVPTGEHAVVIRLALSTDNYQAVYFSDESDYKAFLKTIHSSDNWGPASKQFGMFVAAELH